MKRFRHYYTVFNRMKRSRGFGIHSPFAFNFILRVLKEKNHYYAYTDIKRRRKNAYAMTGKLDKDHPKVISSRNAKLLFRIACYFTPDHILQIGVSYGVSTSAMLDVSSMSRVTIDTCDNPFTDIYAEITTNYRDRINVVNDTPKAIDHYLSISEGKRPFVLINRFRQGDLPTIKDLMTIVLDREGVVILRNIAKDDEMARLWRSFQPDMNHGMSFSNDYTVVLVGLRHLQLQHFNISF